MLTIQQIIDKRKELWQAYLDGKKPNQDEEFVKVVATEILKSDGLRGEIQAKPYLLIECCFTVVDKKKKTCPFFLNEVQKDFIKQFEKYGTGIPYFILKGRQQGFTTLITAIQLSFAIVRKNFSGFTLANSSDNTQTIFNDKARVVYERLPEILKPQEKFNSRNELFFDKLNSSWRIATATKEVGRSKTLNFIHYSEVAFFEVSLSDLQSSIGETATEDCFSVYESTANGFNEAKELWDKGSCINLFYEWWRTAEYTSTEYDYLEKNKGDIWLQERLKLLERKGLSKEQITWYAKKYDGYIDKAKIRQEYPISPEEAFISSGECIFDKDKVANQLEIARDIKPIKKGYFKYKKSSKIIYNSDDIAVAEEVKLEDIRWEDDENGYITIHEEPQTKLVDGIITHKAPYVLGGDTSGLGLDYTTAKVINNITKNTAATLWKQTIDDDLYAEQVYCLGLYYHEALVGIEVNYSLQATKYLSEKLDYPNLYMREMLDNVSKNIVKRYGFETTAKTRPVILSDLQALIRDDAGIEKDINTLKEMLTFIKNDKGKAEAQQGAHDDLVMALAIAHFISSQQTSSWMPVKEEKKVFSNPIEKFFGEDYWNDEESKGSYIEW